MANIYERCQGRLVLKKWRELQDRRLGWSRSRLFNRTPPAASASWLSKVSFFFLGRAWNNWCYTYRFPIGIHPCGEVGVCDIRQNVRRLKPDHVGDLIRYDQLRQSLSR